LSRAAVRGPSIGHDPHPQPRRIQPPTLMTPAEILPGARVRRVGGEARCLTSPLLTGRPCARGSQPAPNLGMSLMTSRHVRLPRRCPQTPRLPSAAGVCTDERLGGRERQRSVPRSPTRIRASRSRTESGNALDSPNVCQRTELRGVRRVRSGVQGPRRDQPCGTPH
jgi:hypothetical protein